VATSSRDPLEAQAWPRLRLAYMVWCAADGWHARGRLVRTATARAVANLWRDVRAGLQATDADGSD